jgi:hypothetical protein
VSEFRLRPPKPKISEKDVEKACLDVLRYRHYWVVRQHVAHFIMPDPPVIQICQKFDIPLRWTTAGEPGLPDWAVMHRERRAFLMETKRPGGKLRPDQVAKIAEIRLGYDLDTLVVSDVDEFVARLDQMG